MIKMLSAVIAIVLLSGCYYDIESELYPTGCDIPEEPFLGEAVRTLIDTKCATPGCHVTGGTGNGNFETYQGVMDKVENGSFEDVTLISQSMPPSGALPSCEQQLIESWLLAGSPE